MSQLSKAARRMLDFSGGVEYIRDRVKTIEEMAGDYEIAHSAERQLYLDALHAIASGATKPHEIAREALKAEKIQFPRYTA